MPFFKTDIFLRLRSSLVTVVAFAIVTMVVLASAAQVFVAYKSLSSFADEAGTRQRSNLRIAATVLRNDLSGVKVEWAANGDAARITIDHVPEFADHGIVDEISRLTGATTTIFAYDPAGAQFLRKSTSVRKSDGSRAVNTILDKSGPVPSSLLAGRIYAGLADILGESYRTAYMPIHAPGGEVVGALYTGVKSKEVDGNIDAWIRSVGLVSIFVLVAFSVAAMLIARKILRPLTDLSASVDKISHGDVVGAVPHLQRADEIGSLAKALEHLREEAVERARLENAAQAERQHELQRQSMMQQLVARFRAIIGEIVAAVDSQAASMSGTAKTLNEVAARAGEAANGARSAASDSTSNIHAVSAAAEQMTASIAEISAQIQGTSERVSRATEIAGETDGAVSGLAGFVAKVGDVVEMIRTIAHHTNMLALNATIEAARAGDAGKGFAVVASEVKTLAGHTAKATDEIAAQIAAIQTATTGAVENIRAITAAVAEIDKSTNAVASAVEQQGEATGEIARAISRASESTVTASQNVVNVAAVIGETNSEAGHVTKTIDLLAGSTRKLAEAVNVFLRDLTQDVDNRRVEIRRRSTRGVVVLSGGARFNARLMDISDTGVKIALAGGLKEGDRFAIEFEDQVCAPARVVWVKDGHAGAQFDQPLSSTAEKYAA